MRGVQAIYGQFWIQGEKPMTAICAPPPESGQTREATALMGVLDALRWRHVLGDRRGKEDRPANCYLRQDIVEAGFSARDNEYGT
jgi:hypothetical protein